MLNNFKILWSRTHIRTDEELFAVNKTIADEAFKKYKKIIANFHSICLKISV